MRLRFRLRTGSAGLLRDVGYVKMVELYFVIERKKKM